MPSENCEIPLSDMSNQVARFLMDCDDPAKRLNYIRRHWGDLDPAHEFNNIILSHAVHDRELTPLKKTVFDFECGLIDAIEPLFTIYGVIVLGMEQTEGPSFILERLHPSRVMYYRTEKDAQDAIREMAWLRNTKIIWEADIIEKDVLFYWYDRRGCYQVICLHETVQIQRNSVQTTIDGVIWTPVKLPTE